MRYYIFTIIILFNSCLFAEEKIKGDFYSYDTGKLQVQEISQYKLSEFKDNSQEQQKILMENEILSYMISIRYAIDDISSLKVGLSENAYVHITIAVDRIDVDYTDPEDNNFFKKEHLIKYSSDAKKYSQSQEYKDFEPKILSVLNESFKRYYKGGFLYSLQIAEDIKVSNRIWDCVINYDGYDGSAIAYTFYTFDKSKRYSVGLLFNKPTSKVNPLIFLERLNLE